MKKISIILVTHNSAGYIGPCLDSIFSQDFKDYEIIVIDNASDDKTAHIIKNEYPGILFLENKENAGPSKARNQGIAKAEGKFILCLDHDVKLHNNFLTNIYNAVKAGEDIGAIQPKVLMADGHTIYSAGIRISPLRRFCDIGSGKKNGDKFNTHRDVFGVSAAAALYRRQALESIKQAGEYFDEDFFYFFEDVDISWRLQKKGWRILYAPQAQCLHTAGRSRRQDKISQYLSMRNRYLLLFKNVSLSGLLRLPFIFLFYDLWRNLFMLITNPKYFLRASLEVVKLSPKMLKKRKTILSCI